MSGKKNKSEQNVEFDEEKAQLANVIVRSILEKATKLTIKLATCECENKESCKVYLAAKEIAKSIDEFQEKIS